MRLLTQEEIARSGLSLTLGSVSNNISKQDMEAFAGMGEWFHAENEIIVREGSSQNHLYTVLDGEVEIFIQSGQNGGSVKQVLTRLGAGKCFGEMALLSGGNASANVEAMGNVILWRINHEHLMEFVGAYPGGGQLCLNMALVLSDRLIEANKTIVHLRESSAHA